MRGILDAIAPIAAFISSFISMGGAIAAELIPCQDGHSRGIRIDYEAANTAAVVVMAPWNEVTNTFPDVRGITERTVYVTADKVVDVKRGQTLRANISKNILQPAPGTHLRDKGGHVVTYIGYEQVPLETVRIQTHSEHISYSSQTGKTQRKPIAARESELLGALIEFDSDAPLLGERHYAGVRCTAKRLPAFGPTAEACVAEFLGWPIGLYVQHDGGERGVQWFRATYIQHDVCIAPSTLEQAAN